MSFKHLTVEQVRKELADIVARYPDRTGGDPDEYNESKACTYFKDAEGRPVSASEFEDQVMPGPSVLVTPVCIVGQWVEDFHPELKNHDEFQFVLLRNAVISTSPEAARIFDPEVFELLGEVQSQQDDDTNTWKDLSF